MSQQPFINFAVQIFAAKKKDPNANTPTLEQQIDDKVYNLYSLTPEDFAIVEGKGK